MNCPKCGSGMVFINRVNVNTPDRETYKEKICLECGHKHYTVEYEVVENKAFFEAWKASQKMKGQDNMDDVKIDPESLDKFIYESTMKKFQERFQEYLELVAKAYSSLEALSKILGTNGWLGMCITDQIEFLNAFNKLGDLCKRLNDQYKIK